MRTAAQFYPAVTKILQKREALALLGNNFHYFILFSFCNVKFACSPLKNVLNGFRKKLYSRKLKLLLVVFRFQ